MKRTFQPNVRRRKKTHGFRERMKTQGRPQGAQAAAREGSQAADRLTRRVTAPAVLTLPRGERLRRPAEFQAVFQQGKPGGAAGASSRCGAARRRGGRASR